MNLVNNKFEKYKVGKQIKSSGRNYTFFRNSLNDFGEPSGNNTVVGNVFGLYHEENSFISISTGETTQYRNKKQPKILCLFEDIANLGLVNGDFVWINGKLFSLSSITNIQEWGIVADISLEEVVENVSNS